MEHIVKAMLLTLFIMFASEGGAATCSLYGGHGSYTIPVSVSDLTAGNDLPDGTILYRYIFSRSEKQIICDAYGSPYDMLKEASFINNTLPLSSWNQNPYPGKVYETGVPGVGVAFISRNTPIPNALILKNVPGGTVDTTEVDFLTQLLLIKTGPISPGVINTSIFPNIHYRFSTPFSPNIDVATLAFTGTINITAGTCKTPDITVELGKKDMNALPSASDAGDMQLFEVGPLDCSMSYGYVFLSGDSSAGPTATRITPNLLTITYSPVTPWIDARNGVIDLMTGPRAATGAGVQILDGVTKTPLDLTAAHKVTLPAQSQYGGFKLGARYVRTTGALKPGKASAALVYTITYK